MSCRGILIVEDDADIRMNLSQALQMEGYTTHQARDGIEALAVLAGLSDDQLPSCILLDIQMPRMTGDEFYRELQTQHADTWAKIPIIVATAKDSPMSPSQIPCAVERIQKPMDLDELFRVVEKHCGKPETKTAP